MEDIKKQEDCFMKMRKKKKIMVIVFILTILMAFPVFAEEPVSDPQNYYQKLQQIVIINDTLYYSIKKSSNPEISGFSLYCANLDGSNARPVVEQFNHTFVVGIDGKIYFIDSKENIIPVVPKELKRCNPDGSCMETLYQTKEDTIYLSDGTPLITTYKYINIEFANASGIQTDKGFFDIASGIFEEGKKVKAPVKEKITPSEEEIKKAEALLPHHNYADMQAMDKIGDYFKLYIYQPTGNPMMPYVSDENFLINAKTNTCVATNVKGTPFITELGMFVDNSDGLYRIEDGGALVKILALENPSKVYCISHGRIYYKTDIEDSQLRIVDNLLPAPLPTQNIY